MSQTNDYPQLIELLNKAGHYVARIEEDNKKNALKFNVFSALGVTRKEVIQSRFLSYLLDPNEHHCQGAIFLNAFLTKIDLPKISTEEQIKCVRVAPEHLASEGLGIMNIVLFCQPDWLVVIENKVDAGEGEQQLPRYNKWLDKQQGYLKKLIFLTPTGHESVTGKDVDYLPLSYLGLAEAFEPLLNNIKAESVRIVLTQYIKNCKLIGGMDVTKDQQLFDLLAKPENIKIALEIEQQTRLIRTQVAKEFGEHVQKILQRKLELAKLESIWKAKSVFYNENQLDLQIETLKPQGKPNYFMKALSVFYESRTESSLGWVRPQRVNFKTQSPAMLDTKDLTNKMINNGCIGANGWLVGSKNLRDGKNGFVLTDIDDIFACIEDNRTEDHPLANTIAEELWLMFTTYREDIEALDSFKQAAA